MSTHQYIDRLCAAALVLTLLLTVLFMNGESLGVQPASKAMGYEARLFDSSRVHTLDIVMDDWEGFIETCENEEYASCAVIIDGESYRNVGIRAKGNTSLSMVSTMDSSRYSFKLEFDHYDSTRTYYGLDKLSLNNVIQDTTYMKDYLTYQLMNAFGAAAPLCSYIYITVNGQDWGLYLAVEGVENGFLQRNYGNDIGELYKPDSQNLGGGRGNGREFRMDDVWENEGQQTADNALPSPPEDFAPPGNFEPGSPPSHMSEDEHNRGGDRNGFSPGGPGGGMGSDDVKLRYIDEDPDSYVNIFENAKTDITNADQTRLINSLKALNSGEQLEDILDIDQVLRYFVVHNYVCNGDSYTGSIVHNYYLYEKDGRLSMIPWDYNLAFGTFQNSDASQAVNAPIDTPVSGGDSRPMVDWIFDSDEYTALYHQYFSEFLETVNISDIIDAAEHLIAPYVEKDPTKFYSYEEFESGAEALREFCRLRSESISGQLDGTIPSTEEGQNADSSALIDSSHLTLSDMGTMNMGGMGDRPGGGFARRTFSEEAPPDSGNSDTIPSPALAENVSPSDGNLPDQGSDGEAPLDFKDSNGRTPSVAPEDDVTADASNEKTAPAFEDSGTASVPPNLEGRPSAGGKNQRPGFPGQDDGLPLNPANNQNLPLTLVSAAVLLAGLAFAFKFKRHG